MNEPRSQQAERERPFVQLEQDGLVHLARTSTAPYPVRLAWLAQGRANKHGHAPMKRGEVAQVLGITDKYNARRAIREAVAAGLLDKRSGTTCLVLPDYLHHKSKDWRPTRNPCDRPHRTRVGGSPHDPPT